MLQAQEVSFQEFSILTDSEINTEENIDSEYLINSGLTPEQSEIILHAENEQQYDAGIQSIHSFFENDTRHKNIQPIPPILYDTPKNLNSGHEIQANAPVSHYWINREGRTINLRRNIKTKIESKHNLTWRVPRAVTNYYSKKYYVNGQKYTYEAKVHHIRCTGWFFWRKCRIIDTVTVLTSVDFRTNTSDGKHFGVTTTYCKNRGNLCPDFVKKALNI